MSFVPVVSLGSPAPSERPRDELRQPVAGLPDPGERVPGMAWPTVGLFVGTGGLFALEMAGVLLWDWSRWVTVPMGAAVTFLMFSVLHESIHHAASSRSWVNDLLGHASMPFVVAWSTYPIVKFIHIEHHRHTNEPKAVDPDGWTHEGPRWQLLLRWATLDLWYLAFYATRLRSRPRRESVTAVVVVMTVLSAIAALVVTGHGDEFLWGYLIPQRIGVVVLAWWFDYLPHHGLTTTQREDKYRATRVRVGAEGVFTPLFVYQNYHLVHHLHPSVPFYRYVRAWRRNEEAYLDRNAAISTWFGRSLTPSEYRTWRRLTDAVGSGSGTRARFHPLRVVAVAPLTPDAVEVTFEVPEDLRREYGFVQGQHVTLRAVVDGHEVRRTYSLTGRAQEAPGTLTVAAKRREGGAFSTYLTNELEAGDILDVMTPSGRFHVEIEPAAQRHLVAVAAGSGITPVLSVLDTMLHREPGSAVTLLYGNRDRSSTMFADRLDDLVREHPGRLTVHHVHSQGGPETQRGRLTAERIEALVPEPSSVAAWFLCGPSALVEDAREVAARLAPEAAVVTEVFDAVATPVPNAASTFVRSTVTVSLDGSDTSFELDSTGESILDAALRQGLEPPYSCAGGACGTCRARVVLGEAVMDQNHVLTESEVAEGHVLTCQAHPVADEVRIDFDR